MHEPEHNTENEHRHGHGHGHKHGHGHEHRNLASHRQVNFEIGLLSQCCHCVAVVPIQDIMTISYAYCTIQPCTV
jgi:hypothetical protein